MPGTELHSRVTIGMKKDKISAFIRFHSDGGNGYERITNIQQEKKETEYITR